MQAIGRHCKGKQWFKLMFAKVIQSQGIHCRYSSNLGIDSEIISEVMGLAQDSGKIVRPELQKAPVDGALHTTRTMRWIPKILHDLLTYTLNSGTIGFRG